MQERLDNAISLARQEIGALTGAGHDTITEKAMAEAAAEEAFRHAQVAG